MTEIAKNDYYELSYDASENTVFWTMKGYWKDASVVPNFNSDWDKARRLTKLGWKIYSDASRCKVMPEDIKAQKIANQKKSLNSGCVKIARVVDSAITKMSLNKETSEPGMDKVIRQFSSTQAKEAREWLKSQ